MDNNNYNPYSGADRSAERKINPNMKTLDDARKARIDEFFNEMPSQPARDDFSGDSGNSYKEDFNRSNFSNGKKQKDYNPDKRRKKGTFKKVLAIIFKTIFGLGCLCVIAGCVGLVLVSIYLVNVTQDDETLLDINSIKLSYATILMVKDKETDEYYEYQRIVGDENRVWVDYSDMPNCLVNAAVASEDMRFWTHSGVDWKRTVAAFVNQYVMQLYSTTQGGSTIPQQLIKNITTEDDVSGVAGALRKVREIYRALVLSQRFSKEQIMEAYLNTMRFSGNVAGVGAAAQYYFGKECSDLTPAECAAILCITKAPTAYNPFTNPDKNKSQRDTILYQMYEQGYLGESEYNAAQKESDAMVFDTPNTSTAGTEVYSYFTDTVIGDVLDDLVEIAGYTREEAYSAFFEGGLTVYTTMDPFIQSTLEDIAINGEMWPKFYDSDGELEEEQPQAAMVVMDYEGNVLGVVGGLGEKQESRGLNRAVDSTRSTGSSMKPLAAYAPGIELNKIHYSSLFPDTPSTVYNDVEWPRNYDTTYGLPCTVADAITRSLNTVAVHVIQLVGIDFSFDFITTRTGISTLVDSRYSASQNMTLTDRTLSLALGGLTDGVSPLEMCAAYAMFGDGGYYHTPHTYTLVTNSRGDVIIDKTANLQTIKAISDDTAYIMNKLLQNVIYQRTGTGYYALPDDSELPYAGKSGTQSDNTDFWFVGMNPYYVMSLWEGYDEPEWITDPRPHPIQVAFSEVMGTISAELEYKDFPVAEDVVALRYCKASGDLATEQCPDTAIGYYKKDNIPGYCIHEFAPVEEEPAA